MTRLMGFFGMRKPRGFHHTYIYVDERKERLDRMTEKARQELGLAPPPLIASGDMRGKFAAQTTFLRRRKERGRRPLHPAVILFLIALLAGLWYAIGNGIL